MNREQEATIRQFIRTHRSIETDPASDAIARGLEIPEAAAMYIHHHVANALQMLCAIQGVTAERGHALSANVYVARERLGDLCRVLRAMV